MKRVYKIMALTLVAVMLLSVCACGAVGKKDAKKKAPTLTGAWKSDIDMTDMLCEGISEQIGVDMTVSDKLLITLGLDLNEDGSCKLYVDKEVSQKNFEAFTPAFVDAIVEAMYKVAEGQGLSRADFDAAFEMQYETDVKGYVEEYIVSLMDVDALFASAEDVEGFYKAEDGKLIMSYDGENFTDAATCTYKLDGDKLSIDAPEEDADELEEFMDELDISFPIVFTR